MNELDLARRFVVDAKAESDRLALINGRKPIDDLARVSFQHGVAEGWRQAAEKMESVIKERLKHDG